MQTNFYYSNQMIKAFKLFVILKNRDYPTARHSLNVACIMKVFVSRYLKTYFDSEKTFIIGLLHDVGKIPMPDYIFKNYVLRTEEERNLILKHPTYTKFIMGNMGFEKGIIEAASQHHERYNGSGYPSGLKGLQIDPVARILGIVDSFSALHEERPYRKGVEVENAISILYQDQQLFDPIYLKAFTENIFEILDLSADSAREFGLKLKKIGR